MFASGRRRKHIPVKASHDRLQDPTLGMREILLDWYRMALPRTDTTAMWHEEQIEKIRDWHGGG